MPQRYIHPASRNYKKRSRVWMFFPLLLVFSICSYAYYALSRPLPTGSVELDNSIVMQTEAAAIIWPEDGHAAIGTLKDGVLARSHVDEKQRPIASLAKVITALAVLEKAPMQPGDKGMTIQLEKEDEDLYWEYLSKDGTVTSVTAGEKLNQYQSLQAMLLPSSNNMSDTLVRRVFGSMEAYVSYANDMVRRYGLTQTTVDDASGFSPQTVSTPSELIVIGQKALEHPVIAEIVAQEEAEIPVAGIIPNYNGFLQLKGVTGIKPGNTDEAGNCLLFSARYHNESGQDVTFIGVVLGIDATGYIYDKSARLLKSAQLNLRQIELIRGGQEIGTYVTPWGEHTSLVAQESIWSYNVPGDLLKPEFQPSAQPPVIMANQPVGTLILDKEGDKSVQVIADHRVLEPSLMWRLTQPVRSFMSAKL